MSTLIFARQTKSYEHLATNSNTKCNSRYFINSAISKTVLADMIYCHLCSSFNREKNFPFIYVSNVTTHVWPVNLNGFKIHIKNIRHSCLYITNQNGAINC